MSVLNKIALITGGSGTIGKAIAKALLDQNISVILTGRRLNKLEEAKESLLEGQAPAADGKPNANVYAISSDISKEESVVNLFEEIGKLEECSTFPGGGVDILVNNAGINSSAGSLEEETAKGMEQVLAVNVVGAFLCAREAMKRMKQRYTNGGGRVINVGSLSAFSPRPNSASYTTSKYAIHGLTQSLALDGRANKIGVGAIHPGNVVSDLLSAEDVERRGRLEGFISAEDVAQCVVTMVSLPYTANILDMTVMPTSQPFIGRG